MRVDESSRDSTESAKRLTRYRMNVTDVFHFFPFIFFSVFPRFFPFSSFFFILTHAPSSSDKAETGLSVFTGFLFAQRPPRARALSYFNSVPSGSERG